MKNKDLRRYIVSFFITALVFGCAMLLSSYFSQKKIDSLKDVQDNISLDIFFIFFPKKELIMPITGTVAKNRRDNFQSNCVT